MGYLLWLFDADRGELQRTGAEMAQPVYLTVLPARLQTNCSSNPDRGKRFVSSSKYPERLFGPPVILFTDSGGFFRGGKGVRWPVHKDDHSSDLVPNLRVSGGVDPLSCTRLCCE